MRGGEHDLVGGVILEVRSEYSDHREISGFDVESARSALVLMTVARPSTAERLKSTKRLKKT